MLAAVIGAPIGMTGYMTAINNIGASYTAAISAFFPAFGALLSHLFLKERMKGYQWVGLMACLVGVAALGWTPAENIPGDWFLGVAGALVCVFGWGTEAVIIAYGLRDDSVDDENALQIRQTTSALSYALVILPILGGWAPATQAFASDAMPIIAVAALLGTVSYLCYYKAIARIGAAKSMALNITYSAWAIPFSLLLLGIMPDARGVVCAIVIIVGAITASTDFKELVLARKGRRRGRPGARSARGDEPGQPVRRGSPTGFPRPPWSRESCRAAGKPACRPPTGGSPPSPRKDVAPPSCPSCGPFDPFALMAARSVIRYDVIDSGDTAQQNGDAPWRSAALCSSCLPTTRRRP